jgi:hypothetical protein
MSKINYQIVLVYLLSLLFLYPVAAHILMYKIGYLVDRLPHSSFWIKIQIFLSGPGIIILGSILYFKYGQIKLNKIFGAVFVLIGIYWLYILIVDIIKEAA